MPWRMVPLLRRYFRTKGKRVQYLHYKDNAYFDAGARGAYFAEIPLDWLQDSVILVDPDIGLLPPSGSQNSVQHILRSEVLRLKEIMGPSSILMIFQYRGQGRSWSKLIEYSKERLGAFDAIYGGDLSFLCLTSDPDVRVKLKACLHEYGTQNGLKWEST